MWFVIEFLAVILHILPVDSSHAANEVEVMLNNFQLTKAHFQSNEDLYKNTSNSVDISDYPANVMMRSNPPIQIYPATDYQLLGAEKNLRDGVLKLYRDVFVWRKNDVTFLSGPDIATWSQRCHYHIVNFFPEKEFREGPASLPSFISKIDIAIISSSGSSAKSVYHVVLEKVVPLSAARSILSKRPDARIIVDVTTPLLNQFLGYVGINPNQVTVVGEGEMVFVRNLYLPLTSSCLVRSAGLVQAYERWVRDVHPRLYSKSASPASDIYVIDRPGIFRLQNTQEIVTHLIQKFPQFNVFTLQPEKENANSIITKLSKSVLLIGPHGAGLMNMLLLPENASIIEVWNRKSWRNMFCYAGQALHSQRNYYGVYPVSTLNESSGMQEFNDSFVDIARVIDAANLLLAS